METMKLYRLVQNTLTAWEDYYSYESVYYSMGYTSFSGKICKGSANKYPKKKMTEEGKFFYMFPEHAIEYLIKYPLYNSCCKLIEYDVPEDIVYDIIGVGEYGWSSCDDEKFDFPKAETYISKSKFGDVVRSSDVLTREEKLEAYLDETYRRLNAAQVLWDIRGKKLDALTAFNCDSVDEIPREKLAEHHLEHDKRLKNFLADDVEVVKSDFITGRFITVFRSSGMEDEAINETNRRLIEKSGFDFDYTGDKFHRSIDARYAYARLIERHQYAQAKKYMSRIAKKEEDGKHVYYLKPVTPNVGINTTK